MYIKYKHKRNFKNIFDLYNPAIRCEYEVRNRGLQDILDAFYFLNGYVGYLFNRRYFTRRALYK
jgi:hypothetical protein